MTLTNALAVVLLGALSSPAIAAAQTAPPPFRGYVTINGGYQATSNDFGESTTFRSSAEDGRLNTDYSVSAGPAFDIAAGATVWRQLAAGVGVTRFSRSTPLTITAAVPHPFFFNQPRSVEGEVGGLKREELAVHVQARGVIPTRGPLQAMVFGGPSFFRVKQDVISEVAYAETYPYDEASVGQTRTTTASESKIGFNVGGDIAYFFTRQVGVGFTAQFSGATVEVPSPDGGTTDVKAGGLQAGGGLRLRF
jgi:opacity protein-like surface antigen